MGQTRLTADASANWPSMIKNVAERSQFDSESSEPTIIVMNGAESEKELEQLIQREPISAVIDNYDEQYADLFISRRPDVHKMSFEEKVRIVGEEIKTLNASSESWQKGSWVYYPWSKSLLHVLAREDFLELRSIRNHNLITADEQKTLESFNVACAGMSVGSNVALAIGISSYSQKLKIADGAVLSGSNLNRVLGGVGDVGLSKSLVVARKLREMNPYHTIERFGNVTGENVKDFFESPWPIHAVVDEMDNLQMKVLLRIEARKRGLPVIMATDLGDDVMLDVERFDLEPNRPFFHGLVENAEQLLTKDVDRAEFMRRANMIIGFQNASARVQKCIMQIGNEIAAPPQLGGTTLMTGSIVAYAIRKIALGEGLRSGRTIISLDKHLMGESTMDDYRVGKADERA
jgi:tRNA threonylcarbamoyladenosine dehydratase